MEVSVLVNIVAREIRTTTGRNLDLVRRLTGLYPWNCTPFQAKKALSSLDAEVPSVDKWRIPYLAKLLDQRGEDHFQMKNTSDLTDLIDSLCVN